MGCRRRPLLGDDSLTHVEPAGLELHIGPGLEDLGDVSPHLLAARRLAGGVVGEDHAGSVHRHDRIEILRIPGIVVAPDCPGQLLDAVALAHVSHSNDLSDRRPAVAREVRELVRLFLNDVPRELLDPILDACVVVYNEKLDEDAQVEFKGDAKAFVRSYGFLGSILPYANPEWEELAIFLNLLIPKLPAPKEEDLSRGILEAIDMDSYRAEKREAIAIALEDEDAEIGPVPSAGGGGRPEPELDRLSNIVKTFNDMFGDITWEDADRVARTVAELPGKVAADPAYRNAMANSDRQNARIEHDQALNRAMQGLLHDNTELFKRFSDDPDFKRWLADMSFAESYDPQAVKDREAASEDD